MEDFPITERTRVRRHPERGSYERAAAYAILDEALICHVGFTTADGPVVIPTIHARAGDTLYIHGSPASRLLRTLRDGVPACLAVTILDGLVLARSVFNHSMNYRSVIVFGTAREVVEREEKLAAMRAVTEHVVPGRWDEARRPSETEFKGTTILALPLEEASVKMRKGPPGDDEKDYSLDIWAGVLPVAAAFGAPEADPLLPPGVAVPDSVAHYVRPGREKMGFRSGAEFATIEPDG